MVIGSLAYNDKVGPLKDIALVVKAITEVGFKLLSPRKDAARAPWVGEACRAVKQDATANRQRRALSDMP